MTDLHLSMTTLESVLRAVREVGKGLRDDATDLQLSDEANALGTSPVMAAYPLAGHSLDMFLSACVQSGVALGDSAHYAVQCGEELGRLTREADRAAATLWHEVATSHPTPSPRRPDTA